VQQKVLLLSAQQVEEHEQLPPQAGGQRKWQVEELQAARAFSG
jgi:hypothetical protein